MECTERRHLSDAGCEKGARKKYQLAKHALRSDDGGIRKLVQFEKSALPIRSWEAGANAGRQSVSAEIEAKSGQHLKPWLLAQGDQPRKLTHALKNVPRKEPFPASANNSTTTLENTQQMLEMGVDGWRNGGKFHLSLWLRFPGF